MSSNGLKSNRVYYITRRLMYLFMTNIYFLIAISPFILYFLLSGTSLSIYILSFLGIIVGPAFATLLSVLSRTLREEETDAKKDFLYFYKLNFMQGIFAASIVSIILLMCYLDINYFLKEGSKIIAYVFVFIAVFTLAIGIYVFPIISRINAKTRDVFKLAIKLTAKKLYITITIVSLLIIAFFIIKFLKISLIGVLFGPIGIGYLIIFMEKNILTEVELVLKEKYESSI